MFILFYFLHFLSQSCIFLKNVWNAHFFSKLYSLPQVIMWHGQLFFRIIRGKQTLLKLTKTIFCDEMLVLIYFSILPLSWHDHARKNNNIKTEKTQTYILENMSLVIQSLKLCFVFVFLGYWISSRVSSIHGFAFFWK